MKSMKKRFFAVAVSLVMSITLIISTAMPVSAEVNLSQILGMIGGSSGDSVNMSQVVTDWINGLIQEDEESAIDKFVENIKNQWNGVEEDSKDDPEADDDVVIIDDAVADNIAELFNLSVNEIKKSKPGFAKVQTASMEEEMANQLQGGLGAVTGIVESLIGTKDIFTGVIEGSSNENTVTTVYPYGNDIVNNFPLSGKNYVASLKGEDIKDYTVTFAKSGKYTIHIDLKDVEGSAADSGLANVFDVTDKAFATLELGTMSINISVMLKYVNNYVEVVVDRHGMVTEYTMGMGVTFMFLQEDGSYSSEMPYLGVDFEKEGIVYTLTTYYGDFDFETRAVGDADNNGKINSSDARLVLRAASQLETLSEDDAKFCDINSDGKINSIDAREILRASAGIIKLPTTEEVLGYKPYEKSEAVKKQIDDLKVILMAYQAAEEEEAKKELQDYYDSLYGDGSSKPNEEETTTGSINSTGNKVEEIIGGIGNIIGGETNIEDILSGGISDIINGSSSGNSGNSWSDILGGFGNLFGK